MAKIVIKKDKREEPFDVEKLKQSVRINTLDTVLKESEDRINNLVDQIAKKVMLSTQEKERVTTEELRERILAELDLVAPDVAKTWRDYDQEQGKV